MHHRFRKAAGQSATVLLVRDAGGYVFGAFCIEAWKPNSRFFGTGETFVFQLAPHKVRGASGFGADWFLLFLLAGLRKFHMQIASTLVVSFLGTGETFVFQLAPHKMRIAGVWWLGSLVCGYAGEQQYMMGGACAEALPIHGVDSLLWQGCLLSVVWMFELGCHACVLQLLLRPLLACLSCIPLHPVHGLYCVSNQ
jgi:hypothetical protein